MASNEERPSNAPERGFSPSFATCTHQKTNTHPTDCPGTSSDAAGKAAACAGCPNQAVCASGQPKAPDPDIEAISQRLSAVKNIILVLSGKGGVGKSTVAAQLAFALAARGGAQGDIGLLDIDICGPSVPKMLGLEGEEIHQSNTGWSPVYVAENLGVMSIGFLLPNPDDAVIWRGPRKNGLIKQFLKDVDWGPLEYLVIDAPPGTSDEHISIAQFLKPLLDQHRVGAVVVTTPQQVAIIDVRKEINFCKKTGIPVVGVVENMAGLRQPVHRGMRFVVSSSNGTDNGTDVSKEEEEDVTAHVLEVLQQRFPNKTVWAETDVFWVPPPPTAAVSNGGNGNGAEAMAHELGVEYLGKVPMDPGLSRATEEGRSVFEDASTVAGPYLHKIIDRVVDRVAALNQV